ncbi:ankyrin repeat-containing protein [Friedmanniomyces endolithicus]|nr:ankyrin repeat-containing protein [Friedmanniomyces endolithicus]KAK0297878.1 ankyrin repeat-containing protein [Friedmanniomyces endolithicus]KAK1018444.1 ankyrin repeat-containing protein [Friedmanniomyces endolithicus]
MRTITLTTDEVDDLLYYTRIDEAQDLHQTLTELSQKYNCEVRDILEECKDPDTGNSVLHYCSANGLAELLHTLLSQLMTGELNSKAADRVQLINRPNQQGNTPLHWAAYNGHLPVVKLLVDAGADMWVKNGAGHLAMFEAERADKNEVVQYLLEVGGRAVEQTGREGAASAEDEAEVQADDGGVGNGVAKSEAEAEGGVDVEMKDAGIREQVCTLALIDVETIKIFSLGSKTAAALTQTCHQLRRETISTFYSQNVFALDLTACALPKALKWLHGIGKDHILQITKLIIRFSVDIQTQQQRDDAARACTSTSPKSNIPLGATNMGAPVVDFVGAREKLHIAGREFAQAVLKAGVARERIEAVHSWDESDDTRLWGLCESLERGLNWGLNSSVSRGWRFSGGEWRKN